MNCQAGCPREPLDVEFDQTLMITLIKEVNFQLAGRWCHRSYGEPCLVLGVLWDANPSEVAYFK